MWTTKEILDCETKLNTLKEHEDVEFQIQAYRKLSKMLLKQGVDLYNYSLCDSEDCFTKSLYYANISGDRNLLLENTMKVACYTTSELLNSTVEKYYRLYKLY